MYHDNIYIIFEHAHVKKNMMKVIFKILYALKLSHHEDHEYEKDKSCFFFIIMYTIQFILHLLVIIVSKATGTL
jgi:hypothetical protein